MNNQQYAMMLQLNLLQNMISMFIYARTRRGPAVTFRDIQRAFPEAPEDMLNSAVSLHPLLTTLGFGGETAYCIQGDVVQKIEQ